MDKCPICGYDPNELVIPLATGCNPVHIKQTCWYDEEDSEQTAAAFVRFLRSRTPSWFYDELRKQLFKGN